jgi:hypothetical protein
MDLLAGLSDCDSAACVLAGPFVVAALGANFQFDPAAKADIVDLPSTGRRIENVLPLPASFETVRVPPCSAVTMAWARTSFRVSESAELESFEKLSAGFRRKSSSGVDRRVDLMRDSSHQLADRLQLLRLPQLDHVVQFILRHHQYVLRLFLIGDVFQYAENFCGASTSPGNGQEAAP